MHKNRSIWLLLAGDDVPLPCSPAADDVVIAVDGGIVLAERRDWRVDLWLGDFDSSGMTPQRAAIARLTFPSDKSQTDFELALDYVNVQYPQSLICVLGSGGAEADHAFGNLWVLKQAVAPVLLWREDCTIVKASGAVQIAWQSQAADKVSLFALSPLEGICNQGLRWQVENAALAPYVAAFARNEALGGKASVAWQSGEGLLFLPAQSLPKIT